MYIPVSLEDVHHPQEFEITLPLHTQLQQQPMAHKYVDINSDPGDQV